MSKERGLKCRVEWSKINSFTSAESEGAVSVFQCLTQSLLPMRQQEGGREEKQKMNTYIKRRELPKTHTVAFDLSIDSCVSEPHNTFTTQSLAELKQ